MLALYVDSDIASKGEVTGEVGAKMDSLCTNSVRGDISLEAKELSAFREKAHRLFAKYIDCDSPMAINIGGSLRTTLRDLDAANYSGVGPMEFVCVYDDVLFNLIQLIHQCFQRMLLNLYNFEKESERT